MPNPDTDRPLLRDEKEADWPRIQTLPNGMVLAQTRPNWFQQANAQPQPVLNLETLPRASTCVVPLLAVPVNPNADRKMPVLHPPKFKSESAGIVKGLPPCSNSSSK